MAPSGGAASRRKGAAWETAVVNWLRAYGIEGAERSLPGGHRAGGDITGVPGVVLECKDHARLEPGQWVDQLLDEIGTLDVETGAVVIKRRRHTDVGESYALTTMAMYLELLNEAGYVRLE